MFQNTYCAYAEAEIRVLRGSLTPVQHPREGPQHFEKVVKDFGNGCLARGAYLMHACLLLTARVSTRRGSAHRLSILNVASSAFLNAR